MTEIKTPLWMKAISWMLGVLLLIVAFAGFVYSSWYFGLSVYNNILQMGVLLGVGVFILGTVMTMFILIMFSFAIAVVRRIMKWEWLQIPLK